MSAESPPVGMPFEEFLNCLTIPVLELDREWRLVYANEHLVTHVALTRDEVLGQKYWDVFPEAQETKFESEFRRVMETREPTTFKEYYSPLERRTVVWVFPSESGILVYLRDSSEQREMETNLERYNTILELIENGVFLTNEDFEFVEVNRAYSELCGYSRAELVGSHVTKVVPEDDLASAIEIGGTVLDGEREAGVIETELETADGERIPVSSKFVPFIAADGSRQTVGVVRNISKQKGYEHTLTSLHDASRKLIEVETREAVCDLLVEATTEILDFSGVVVYLYEEADETLVPVAHSDDVDRYYGTVVTLPAAPDSSITANVFARGKTTNYDDVTNSELLGDDSVDIRSGLFVPLGDHGIIVIGDSEAGMFTDRTAELTDTLAATAESALTRLERDARIRAREKMVTTLHDATRELMQATTKEEISQRAVTAATELLGLSNCGVFRWNDQQGILEPSAVSSEMQDRFYELPVFESGTSSAWEAFVEGNTTVSTASRDENQRSGRETPFRSELIIPIDTHGVFWSGSTSIGEFDESDIELAKLLAANVGAALDRAEREQNVREQERQLQAQNRELARLNQINSVIRNVVESLVQATTSDQLRTGVCEHLVEAEPYDFAWFATCDPKTGEIEPQAWSEEHAEYFEAILLPAGDGGYELPVERAFESNEPQVVENILKCEEAKPWRKAALKRGYQAAISIPVYYASMVYGVLEVYGKRAAMFTGEEYDVLLELSNILGNALNATERTEALLAGSDTELEFQIPETDDLLFSLARELSSRIEVEALVPSADDSWLLYVLVNGSEPSQVIEAIRNYATVKQVGHIRSEGERELFGIVVSELTAYTTIAEHGATVKSVAIAEGVGRLVLTIPRTTDVRTFVETCREILPDAQLIRRGQAHVPRESEDLARAIETQLTDRQREAIELAYKSGYFAWPRDRTGDEIAEMMGITPPTFHSHLRKGLNSLLGILMDDSSDQV